jgi:hypothetical protein
MSRAPETGYYFEPVHERLALVLEGAAFPSSESWAWVGDPLEMPAEVALLEVATRWPGVDPEGLEIEYETDFVKAVDEIERLRKVEADHRAFTPEVDFDVRMLIAQAEELEAQARLIDVNQSAKEVADLRSQLESVGDAIEQANKKK